MTLNEKLDQAVWIARSLYDRGKTAGSSANLSFLHEGEVFISGGGTCFGTLQADEFARVGADGAVIGERKPSKELPMHRILYEKRPGVAAVLHTHSTYATLWSCLRHKVAPGESCIPAYTPYLGMRLGNVGLIPYAPPGSDELFRLFAGGVGDENGYLLKNHGPVVGAATLMDAYFAMEELEESARIAWELRNEPARANMLIS